MRREPKRVGTKKEARQAFQQDDALDEVLITESAEWWWLVRRRQRPVLLPGPARRHVNRIDPQNLSPK